MSILRYPCGYAPHSARASPANCSPHGGSMRKVWLLTLAVFGFTVPTLSAQVLRVTGRVTSPEGTPLSGVRVEERGTLNRASTRADGTYELRYSAPEAVLTFTQVGFRRQERPVAGASTLDVSMELAAFTLEGVEVVGTRRANRSITETPVAIDIIDIPEVTRTLGQLEVNQVLQYAAPSFNANRQSGADGSDHIDPASLRGLGPDQTLVLVNGKRRHQSSLINIFGSRGRGNTGTDLNAIPLGAIERIEILRDGASAQYGSDAIAGVMNVVLKETVNEFSGSIATGFFNASPPSNLGVLRPEKMDGENVQISANYGIPVGQGGFVNLTRQYLTKQRTNRPADPAEFSIYRRQFGDAALDNFGTFVNSRVPINPNVAFYAFGGYNFRHTDAYAWSRDAASERNVPAIYPQGFDPRILSDITDQSLAAGLRAKVGNWDVDIGNAWGANRFHYFVDGTLNASLLEKSPTRFDAGGFAFGQNTTGVTFSRFFPQALSGVNLAVGAERRMDHYTIFAGEEGSYRNYGIVDSVISGRVVQVDVLGRPGGAQGFPRVPPAGA